MAEPHIPELVWEQPLMEDKVPLDDRCSWNQFGELTHLLFRCFKSKDNVSRYSRTFHINEASSLNSLPSSFHAGYSGASFHLTYPILAYQSSLLVPSPATPALESVGNFGDLPPFILLQPPRQGVERHDLTARPTIVPNFCHALQHSHRSRSQTISLWRIKRVPKSMAFRSEVHCPRRSRRRTSSGTGDVTCISSWRRKPGQGSQDYPEHKHVLSSISACFLDHRCLVAQPQRTRGAELAQAEDAWKFGSQCYSQASHLVVLRLSGPGSVGEDEIGGRPGWRSFRVVDPEPVQPSIPRRHLTRRKPRIIIVTEQAGW